MHRLSWIVVTLIVSSAFWTVTPTPAADNATPSKTLTRTFAADSPTEMATSLLLAASKQDTGASVQPTSPKNPHRFLTRRRIALAVVAGCLIATAIAVPIGIHAHQQHERHAAARRALNNAIAQENQKNVQVQSIINRIAADQRREQQIQALLSSGKLTKAQSAGLQQELAADIADAAQNRAQLSGLIANNFFGMNSPTIATVEAEYEQMWAQDVAALFVPVP